MNSVEDISEILISLLRSVIYGHHLIYATTIKEHFNWKDYLDITRRVDYNVTVRL